MAEIVYSADNTATWTEDIVKEFRDAFRYRYVIFAYVTSNLRLRYRRSSLGFIWSVLVPLMNYIVVGLVFSFASKTQIDNFFAYFFSGSVFFQLFQSVLVKAPYIMIENENYIKKIYVPKVIFVCCTVCLEGVNFLLGLSALLFLGLVTGHADFGPAWILLPFVIFCALLFLAGISCVLAIGGVFFRDIAHIIPFLMQTAFFVTPILYPVTMIPDRFKIFLTINPLYYFIESFRAPLFNNIPINWNFLVIIFVLAMISFFFGISMLKRYDNRIVFKL